MSRKHNTKHPERGKSRYGERLTRRGMTKAPALEDLDTLRKRQEKRKETTGVPWYAASGQADADAA